MKKLQNGKWGSPRNLFPPLDNPELTIRRRSRTDPTLLNNSEMAVEGNGDLPVPDLRTMEELCQPSLNGRGGPIAAISIQATNFRLKNNMIQQVQSSCQFHGLPEIATLKAQMAEINKNLMRVLQVNQQVKAITPNCETYGGPHFFSDCPATIGQTQNVYATGAYQAYQAPAYQAPIYQAPVHQPQIPQPQVITTNEFTNFMMANDVILKNMQTNMTYLTNLNLELKNMFGQFIKMNTASSLGSGTLPVVERETEATKYMVHPTNNESTEDVQPPVVLTKSLILNSKPVISPIIEPVASLISAPKPNQIPLIPYPSKIQDQKLCDKANDQQEKFFQIFNDLNFNISFADALILMSKFGPSIKSLLTNKDKLCELTRTPLNEHCLAVLLKKLPEKLRDPELTDRLISCLVGVAKDVFVKVETFHFPADFVVVDFDADSRVPLILRKSFLKTGRALIDVFEGELTLCVGKEAITFNLDQTSRYSANYNDMTTNQIDVIDMACEEYLQEVLSFSDVIASGNPTPYYDPIVSTTSLTLTPFRNIDFLLKEVDAFLAIEDDPTSHVVDQSYELKICEAKSDKSSIDEPPKVELKDLPPYLEYVFLEGNDKFPVIIVKDLSKEEKTAFITVLKSHKRAIAWKLFDIKGINIKFCTHKILIEEDFEPAVQHQRRVNPKIHDVMKNEVLKLLDAGLIYPISDSPWEIIRIEESLNVTFDESFLEPKLSPSVEDDRINEPIVQDLNGSPPLQVNVLNEGYSKSVKEARGERMVLLDNPLGSPDNVLDKQIFDTVSDDSHQSNTEIYLNDEEDDGDNMIIPQTPSEKIRTRIDNIKCPPSFLKKIGVDSKNLLDRVSSSKRRVF
nr:hypothetical protein [Tanacetum cinerariifolium]